MASSQWEIAARNSKRGGRARILGGFTRQRECRSRVSGAWGRWVNGPGRDLRRFGADRVPHPTRRIVSVHPGHQPRRCSTGLRLSSSSVPGLTRASRRASAQFRE